MSGVKGQPCALCLYSPAQRWRAVAHQATAPSLVQWSPDRSETSTWFWYPADSSPTLKQQESDSEQLKRWMEYWVIWWVKKQITFTITVVNGCIITKEQWGSKTADQRDSLKPHTHNTQMNNQRRIFWGNRSDKGHECWPQCSETSPVVSDALWQFGFQWNAAGGARTWIIIGLLLSLLLYFYQWFSSCTSYALDPVMSASIWAPPTAACRFSHCWLLLESIQTGESDTEKQSFKKTHTHALY